MPLVPVSGLPALQGKAGVLVADVRSRRACRNAEDGGVLLLHIAGGFPAVERLFIGLHLRLACDAVRTKLVVAPGKRRRAVQEAGQPGD